MKGEGGLKENKRNIVQQYRERRRAYKRERSNGKEDKSRPGSWEV